MAARVAGHQNVSSALPPSTPRSMYITNLNPIKRKLDRIETERVYRVVQRCSRNFLRVKFLSLLVEDDSRLFRITDEELRGLVLNHQKLARSSNVKIELLKESTKSIIRYCKVHAIELSSFIENNNNNNNNNKNNRNIMMQQTSTRNTISSLSIDNLRNFTDELKEIMHEKLLSEIEEERARWKYLLQSMEKSRLSLNASQQLRKSLEECIAMKNQFIGVKDEEIFELKNSLEATQQTVDNENNTSLNEAAKQILTNQKSLGTKTKKLSKDRFQYTDNLTKATSENYNGESKLRKRKFKMAGELHNWILKYDQDMGWRQDEIDQLQELNKKDLEDLVEIENHFEKLSKEYDIIMEERKQIAEEQIRKEKEMQELKEAIVKIQSIWRGYETRKLFMKYNKGGKKGAAKKGGKKKK